MDSIYRGDLGSAAGRRNAWADSLFVDHAILRVLWTNFHAVRPGVLYRSNHPTPARLARYARRYGIRTLINLRGQCGNGSDALAREAAERLGIDFVDAPLRSRQAPTRAGVLHLLDVFRTMRAPALVHCKSGADRAGLAAGVFLLDNGGSAAEAMRQLSWRFGHIPGSPAGIAGAFLRLFAAQGEGRMPFTEWVRTKYDPAALTDAFAAGRLATLLTDRVLVRE